MPRYRFISEAEEKPRSDDEGVEFADSAAARLAAARYLVQHLSMEADPIQELIITAIDDDGNEVGGAAVIVRTFERRAQ